MSESEQAPEAPVEATATVELDGMECAVILTGISSLLAIRELPPPKVVQEAMDRIIRKLTDAAETMYGADPVVDKLRASFAQRDAAGS